MVERKRARDSYSSAPVASRVSVTRVDLSGPTGSSGFRDDVQNRLFFEAAPTTECFVLSKDRGFQTELLSANVAGMRARSRTTEAAYVSIAVASQVRLTHICCLRISRVVVSHVCSPPARE